MAINFRRALGRARGDRLFVMMLLGLLAAALAVPAVAQQTADKVHLDASRFMDPTQADHGLQAAIDQAADAGGGVVQFPAGTFRLRAGLVLRDHVTLLGAGMDETVLTPARQLHRLEIAPNSPTGEDVVYLERIPETLEVGSAVVSCSEFPPSWYGSPRPAWVTAIDRQHNTVTLEAPYGLNPMTPGRGVLIYGDAAALDRDIHQGDTEIHLKSASLFKVGDQITLGQPGNNSLLNAAFVKEVRGNTLVLTEPVRVDFEAWPDAGTVGPMKINALLWTVFPMLQAANLTHATVKGLTVQGTGLEPVHTTQTYYTVAGIHLFNGRNVRLENVAVRDWPTDGFSLQAGEDCRVIHCQATGNLGNGFHPGTGLKTSVFEGNLSSHNGAGLYLCWHNRGHLLRHNQFVHNRGGGITGLGHPGDHHNTIEHNLIAHNAGPGIAINGGGGDGSDSNGGQGSGNVIHHNTIENNSQQVPGKYPGIALHASLEDARGYTIVGNTIRDTQDQPTQYLGIEEKDGQYRGNLTRADANVIRDNTLTGHPTTDIQIVGAETVVEGNGEARVLRLDRAAHSTAQKAKQDAEQAIEAKAEAD